MQRIDDVMAAPLGRNDSIHAQPREMLRRKALPQAEAPAEIHDVVRTLIEKREDFQSMRIGKRPKHVGGLHLVPDTFRRFIRTVFPGSIERIHAFHCLISFASHSATYTGFEHVRFQIFG